MLVWVSDPNQGFFLYCEVILLYTIFSHYHITFLASFSCFRTANETVLEGKQETLYRSQAAECSLRQGRLQRLGGAAPCVVFQWHVCSLQHASTLQYNYKKLNGKLEEEDCIIQIVIIHMRLYDVWFDSFIN